MICYPNAKINLGLYIINKREDGFHNIETVFYPIGLTDALECVENKDYRVSSDCLLISNGLKIQGNLDDNLIAKAYYLLKNNYDLPPVIVHLNKKIPMGAGLGGGSSDAAYMLKLLNELFNLKLTNNELKNYAALLGSDCAFFIDNTPAYVFGKGHELTPINLSLSNYYIALVHDGTHSNTALAYKHAICRGNENINLLEKIQEPINTWKETIENDFEKSVFHKYPHLANIKEWMYYQGALYAAMSGSGSTILGIFNKKPNLQGSWVKYIQFIGKL